jgi:hypothetical protein
MCQGNHLRSTARVVTVEMPSGRPVTLQPTHVASLLAGEAAGDHSSTS